VAAIRCTSTERLARPRLFRATGRSTTFWLGRSAEISRCPSRSAQHARAANSRIAFGASLAADAPPIRPPTQHPVIIRVAQPADAVYVAATEREVGELPGFLVGQPGEIAVEAYAAKIVDLLDRGRYAVAEESGLVVGHGFLDPMTMAANAHVFVLTLVVRPEGWGRGIGRALLSDLLRWASTDPRVHKIELLVRATNERAIRLYEGAGFREEGRLLDRVRLLDGRYVDDLTMAWFRREPRAS
jgi:RimJ/RimL family protein N-acetyltransferase